MMFLKNQEFANQYFKFIFGFKHNRTGEHPRKIEQIDGIRIDAFSRKNRGLPYLCHVWLNNVLQKDLRPALGDWIVS